MLLLTTYTSTLDAHGEGQGALAVSALHHWLLVATALLHIELLIIKKCK